MSKIETKWLPVGHFGFYICKICHVLSLFYISALAILQDFRNNVKTRFKMTIIRPFSISFLRNLSWVILV